MSFTISLLRSKEEGSMSDWRSTLPRQFNLDEAYCITLKEISFTDSIFNITRDYYIIVFSGVGFTYESILHAGRYDSLSGILNVINKKISHFITWDNKPKLIIKGESVVVDPLTTGTYFLEPALASFLGYKNPNMRRLFQRVNSSGSNQASTNYFSESCEINKRDKFNPLRSMMVYTDITDYTIVGDTLTNLLRVVTIPSNSLYGEQVVTHFKSPQFVNLSNHSFSSIHILIKDSTGSDIIFNFGKIILTLLFKPISSSMMSFFPMERNEFRIILPSNTTNGEKIQHHQNTLTHWKTILPQTLNLDGRFEVALIEISYTFSWFNVNYDVDCIIVDWNGNEVVKSFRLLDRGHYSDVSKLINEMNHQLAEMKTENDIIDVCPGFIVHKYTQKVSVAPGKTTDNRLIYPITAVVKNSRRMKRESAEENGKFTSMIDYEPLKQGASLTSRIDDTPLPSGDNPTYFIPSSELADTYKSIIGTLIKEEQSFSDLTSTIRTVFVHSNIIEHSVIGDKFGQVLRTVEVPAKAEHNDQVTFEYSDPIFHPLISNHIPQITIHLKDDRGDNIPFQNQGESRVTLLFRKILE